MSRDGVIRYLERYAAHHGLSLCTGTTISRVERDGRGWVLRSPQGDLHARAVVIATGYNHTSSCRNGLAERDFPANRCTSASTATVLGTGDATCWSSESATPARRSRSTSHKGLADPGKGLYTGPPAARSPILDVAVGYDADWNRWSDTSAFSALPDSPWCTTHGLTRPHPTFISSSSPTQPVACSAKSPSMRKIASALNTALRHS